VVLLTVFVASDSEQLQTQGIFIFEKSFFIHLIYAFCGPKTSMTDGMHIYKTMTHDFQIWMVQTHLFVVPK
jgi:hypothetical protein